MSTADSGIHRMVAPQILAVAARPLERRQLRTANDRERTESVGPPPPIAPRAQPTGGTFPTTAAATESSVAAASGARTAPVRARSGRPTATASASRRCRTTRTAVAAATRARGEPPGGASDAPPSSDGRRSRIRPRYRRWAEPNSRATTRGPRFAAPRQLPGRTMVPVMRPS